MLRCRACKARFSERKGTPLFGSHLPEAKAVAVMSHLAEGVGVRKTGRLVGVNRETVASYARKAGAHAKALHDERVAISPPDARGPVRREVGLRRQGEELRPR
jgi:LacI family transcriptional regulator